MSGAVTDAAAQLVPEMVPADDKAAEPAVPAGDEAFSAADAEHAGLDASAAELAATGVDSTRFAAMGMTPNTALSAVEAASPGGKLAASGVVASLDATSATNADAGAAAASANTASGIQPGAFSSVAAGEPGAAGKATANADDTPTRATGSAAPPASAENTGSAGKPADSGNDLANSAANAAARDSAKNELMAQLEQGEGNTTQLQPKPGDLSAPKPEAPALPEAPLPPGAKAIPPGAVPVEIGLRTLQGLREFQIRLDPAELGRVDVRLEINDDKTVSARVVVDRVETLHLLQRDAKTLERAFEQAGLKSSDGGIDITLRDPGQQARQERGETWTGEGQISARRNAAAVILEPTLIPIRRTLHVGALDRSI